MSGKLNVLAAYPYMKQGMIDVLAERQDTIRFLLDSGAFTAWKLGKPIALDDYCRFIESLPFRPWRYFTLDVIGDPVATRQNYETMLKRGFGPVPILTRGEDPRALDDYYETSDLVGLGGLAGTNQEPPPYLKWLWPQLKGRQVHVLGFSDMEWLKFFKPYSCDSSNWLYGTRYANVGIYVGHGRIRWLNNEKFKKRPPPEVLQGIRDLGYDPMALQKQENWKGGNSVQHWISAGSWVKVQRDLEKHLGVKYFLACAAKDVIPVIVSNFIKQTTGAWAQGSGPFWRPPAGSA